MFRRLLLLLLVLVPTAAGGVVVRDDVDDARYRAPSSRFRALVDLQGEGHGVLIAPQWVVTVAHALSSCEVARRHVVLDGVSREVARIVVHPGYWPPPQVLLDNALASWDWTLFVAWLAASDDIALLQLAQPVTDVTPVPLHQGDNEFDRRVRILGKGATGNGASGYDFADSHRTALREAHNTVSSAHGRWLCHVFDQGAAALPLEGSVGSGDSGGPVLIETDGQWRLAGLTAWTAPAGATRERPGKYGQIGCSARIGHYASWIAKTLATAP